MECGVWSLQCAVLLQPHPQTAKRLVFITLASALAWGAVTLTLELTDPAKVYCCSNVLLYYRTPTTSVTFGLDVG